MNILFFLVTICDVAVYMMFANFFSQSVFGGGAPSLGPLLILSATASCSFLLFKVRPWLRFLPILLLPVCFFWVRDATSAVLLSLPCAYVSVMVFRKKLAVEAESLRRRTKSYAKFVFLPLMGLLLYGYETMVSFGYFHFLSVYIVCALCIMRLSRAGGKTASDPKYVLINAGAVVGSLAVLVVLGMSRAFDFIWQGALFLLVALRDLLSSLGSGEIETPNFVGSIFIPEDEFEFEPVAFIPGYVVVLILLGLLVAVLVFFAARDLGKKGGGKGGAKRKRRAASGLSEVRSSAVSVPGQAHSGGKQNLFAPRDQRSAVRQHYRQFLKMCAKKGSPPETGDTSKDVNHKNRGNFQDTGMSRLRDIYIRARYSEHDIESSESAEAGKLVKGLRGAGR